MAIEVYPSFHSRRVRPTVEVIHSVTAKFYNAIKDRFPFSAFWAIILPSHQSHPRKKTAPPGRLEVWLTKGGNVVYWMSGPGAPRRSVEREMWRSWPGPPEISLN